MQCSTVHSLVLESESAQKTELVSIREGVKKTIESVMMIIAGRGGGGPRVVITPSKAFFSMLQTYLFGSIMPQNKLCC